MNFRKFVRDYLEYYPSEKKGVFYLAVLIVLWAIGLYFYTRQPVVADDDKAFQLAVAEYYQNLEAAEAKSVISESTDEEERVLFQFNPNVISYDSLLLLGLPERTAHSIMNYRKSGGQFRKPDDLAKIYTLSDREFDVLKPYIRIPQEERQDWAKDAAKDSDAEESPEEKVKGERPVILVNVNRADTTELMNVRGVGSYFAGAIVEHREKLGGFHNLNQLLEIFLIDEEKLEEIAPYLELTAEDISRINLNTVSFDELRQHPYISYRVANSIVRMREQHGPYRQIEDLRRSHLMNDSIFARIKPYISVHD